jgi:curved DNA-binding protein CbpA
VDDHYEALGLEPDATPEEIKKAFKALALQYHPDQHPTPIAAAIFRRLNEAYKVLSDPQERKRYDELRRIRTSRRPSPRPSPESAKSKPRPKARPKARPKTEPGSGPKKQAPRSGARPGAEEPVSERVARLRREGVHRYRYAKQRQKQARQVSRETVAENKAKLRELLGDETDD